MSLFGTSPDEPAFGNSQSNLRSSIFGDEPASGTSSSLFADEDTTIGAAPWGIPTPKKAARAELVKTLLPAAEVPESYIDTFDQLLENGECVGAGISLTGVKKILESSGLAASTQARILNIVVPGGQETASGLGRGEFNVLLALIAIAQENEDEDVTLDSVDERRKNLPEPAISILQQVKASKASGVQGPVQPQHSRPVTPPSKPSGPLETPPAERRASAQRASSFPESDPWASPGLHRDHSHVTDTIDPNSSREVGNGAAEPSGAERALRSEVEEENTPGANGTSRGNTLRSSGGWGPNSEDPSENTFADPGSGALGGGGFGATIPRIDANPNSETLGRSLGGGKVYSGGVQETVTIELLPEKEGMFMFRHRNYQVSSVRRNTKVIRRYSDFVWLLDCLQKRYPFRQLPLLPPKKIVVNGNHILSDISFLEKRRRGLVRFTNALIQHPVLSQEQLVIMFLTVPTELTVWRKQATISIQEEFIGKVLPPELEDSLPATLMETFDTVRSGVRRSAEIYINLCTLLERLIRRNEGIAADCLRFSLALRSLSEASSSTYAIDTNDVPLLNEGIKSTAKHLSASQSLLEDEGRAWDEGVLEDLKRQRDGLVSMRDMFDRRDRYAKDNIPTLERRIQNNESRLIALRNKPDRKPGELERVEDAIVRDKQSIIDQHARGVFIKECIRDEIFYFQRSQYHVSRLHQDWSQERVKYTELQADNWRSLSDELEGMPVGE
ncbi:sorting nexin Mvp1 [Xylona heveae TC161]|uniref:Sorting nexin MVP1 n=1 Tax=Xylona heveae (strain CBS 132557 / TC161) TaxID=1328760 RepID=A0A165K2R6_XYLHT|nr:sorting nexin Mvp1 [Xylona heveae TC161]KZF26919.1 sorting nexin Mvp1 [Xylona heveae TC161]